MQQQLWFMEKVAGPTKAGTLCYLKITRSRIRPLIYAVLFHLFTPTAAARNLKERPFFH